MSDAVRFVNFVAGLAPEGETALLVRQKPKLENGAPVFHADGVCVSTFVPYVPEKARIQDGEAWYANTGAFVLDRFENGQPRAKRENCDYVLFMMLDDIGTKSKAPPVEPTWIMETSPGSFQWGYAFDEQPTRAEFTAAIKAVAAAGFTDPGATNAVRNSRIPGSVNLKKGREGFAARLVEFHPERLFNLGDLCAAMGVTPGDSGADYTPYKLNNTGGDSVLEWLAQHSLVLGPANEEGWQAIVCPNNAQHSNGDPEARYHSLDRGFLCYHGCCQDLRTTEFLTWVSEQGGPSEVAGLRDDVLVEVVGGAVAKLATGTQQEADAQRFLKDLQRREATRAEGSARADDDRAAAIEKHARDSAEKAVWFSKYAYVESDNGYFDFDRRDMITRQAFDATYRHVICKSPISGKVVSASIWYDENRHDMGGKVLTGLTYAAGDGAVVATASGALYGNRWTDARPARTQTRVAPTPWLEHCKVLVPDDANREHVWDVMAHKLQKPHVKINHAVLHMGDEGCGKDLMWSAMVHAVCGVHFKNRAVVSGEDLTSQWGYVYESEILILNELQEPAAAQRRVLANRLKPLIAAPPETISVNRKMLHPYEVANRLFVLAFSNEAVPISLSSQDRRWFVIRSDAPRMTPADADRMWTWCKQGGGYEAVAEWLYARDISKFNPFAAPGMTDAKKELLENGLSTSESWIVEQVAGKLGEFRSGAVGAPFHKLIDRLKGSMPPGKDLHLNTLLHALKHAGWVNCGRLHSRAHPTYKQVWAAPDVLETTAKSDIRALVEPLQGGSTVVPLRK